VDATRSTLSEIADDRSDESVTGLVSRQASRSEHFLGQVEALIAQQSNHAEHAVTLTRRIAELGERVSSIAFQSRLLSLNASVEAARLNGQGAAFGVISVEMKRLSDAVEEANQGVADLANELTEALPNIAKVGSELLHCSKGFRHELETGLREIQDVTSALKSTIGSSLSDGDRRIDRVIYESNSALSHLQFQDVCAQSLLIIDKDLDNTRSCIKNIVASVGAAAVRLPDHVNCMVERADSNRDKASGEVVVLNGGPSASDAGEVMFF
jgi:methyl-accepting chemotaxis protein